MATIFEKIINRELPADIVYENDHLLAFRDINPQAPTHILVIPKKPISSISDVEDGDKALMGELLLAVKHIAAQEDLDDYRVVVNNGIGAGQSVFHLHLHIMAGRSFSWPPG